MDERYSKLLSERSYSPQTDGNDLPTFYASCFSSHGQFLEWKSEEQLEWQNLEDTLNHQMRYFTSQLNHFYKEHRALWEIDDSYDGLSVIDADNTDETVLTIARQSRKGELLIGIFNMTPVERRDFTVGVPVPGRYEEVLNSELASYGGTWEKTNPPQETIKQKWRDYHLSPKKSHFQYAD